MLWKAGKIYDTRSTERSRLSMVHAASSAHTVTGPAGLYKTSDLHELVLEFLEIVSVEFAYSVRPEVLGVADVPDVGLQPTSISIKTFLRGSYISRVVARVGRVVLTSYLCVGSVAAQLATALKPV